MSGDRPYSPTELKRLHREWRRRGEGRLALILDGVQNPYNLGAILRSAAAYRVERIWRVPPTLPVTHPKVAKTSLGCERLVESIEALDATAAVEAARTGGFQVVGVELSPSARPLFELDLGCDTCLVVGHEERGVHRDVLRVVDAIGFAPLTGKVGSLNVAHATSIALYEASRQQLKS